MGKEEGQMYRGKTLDEIINISTNDLISDEEEEEENDDFQEKNSSPNIKQTEKPRAKQLPVVQKQLQIKNRKIIPWSEIERNIVTAF